MVDLLKRYLKEMNSLVDKPEFYDALIHNCTTTIELHANAINSGEPPPLDWRLIANGHVDEFLYELGIISSKEGYQETSCGGGEDNVMIFVVAMLNPILSHRLSEN